MSTLDAFFAPDSHPVDRRALLEIIVGGMRIALQDRGECSVQDGYALLGPNELAYAKERQLGQIAVRILRETYGLRKADVVNSPEPSRKGGYCGVWKR